jgi:hypothetical protein
MADTSKKFIAFPRGKKKLSREEAKELGRQMFDAIVTEQAANARKAEDDERKRRRK